MKLVKPKKPANTLLYRVVMVSTLGRPLKSWSGLRFRGLGFKV